MHSTANPTARALRTLELVRNRPGITARELADRLDVTDRAARRYVATLRAAGVDVESTSGPYGGYRLGRGVRLPPLVFTPSEALSLVMAVLDGHHAAADAEDPVGSAVGKILDALPGGAAGPARAVRRHALAAPDRSAARPDPDVTASIVDALTEGIRIHIAYKSGSGSTWRVDVDPWAIVVRHGRWYLLCHAHDVDASRTYRIDRIQTVDTLAEPSSPPPDLDPVAAVERSLGTGWRYPTHVIFDAPPERVAPHVTPPMGTLSPIDDGARTELHGSTNNPAMYAAEWLARIPIPFHVIEGPELHHAVAAVAGRMAAAVSPPKPHKDADTAMNATADTYLWP